jgi:hypothetical protein
MSYMYHFKCCNASRTSSHQAAIVKKEKDMLHYP